MIAYKIVKTHGNPDLPKNILQSGFNEIKAKDLTEKFVDSVILASFQDIKCRVLISSKDANFWPKWIVWHQYSSKAFDKRR